jgi:diguanylate cyclase (GGDEF)-like protein/PAS domain S-box-containing protein
MSDAGFRAIFEHALDPMLVAADDARYVDANPAACEFFGLSRAELCARRVVDFAPPQAKAEFSTAWSCFLHAGKQRGEYQLELPDGRVRDIEFSATANILPGRHLSIIRDVSDRKVREAERERLMVSVQTLARTDPLTELPNRRVWTERVTEELQRAKRSNEPPTIAIIDLDDFKTLNDTHGHAAGDRLLKALARGWQAQLREIDLLARVGGDEFCLLLPSCSAGEERRVLQRLRAVMPNGQTFSAGAATWDGEEQPERLFERADRALYQDKKDDPLSETQRLQPDFGPDADAALRPLDN